MINEADAMSLNASLPQTATFERISDATCLRATNQPDGAALRVAIAEADRPWAWELDRILFSQDLDDLSRARRLYLLTRQFRNVAGKIGRAIIEDSQLQPHERRFCPVHTMGIAGGEKYMVSTSPITGIFFKLAVDTHGLYGGDAYAAKAATQDLKSAQALAGASADRLRRSRGRIASLRTPLMATVDFLGRRLLAASMLPLSASSHVYGSSDGGRTLPASSPRLVSAFRVACKELNIAGHNLPVPAPPWAASLRAALLPRLAAATGSSIAFGSSTSHVPTTRVLWGPVDIEGHMIAAPICPSGASRLPVAASETASAAATRPAATASSAAVALESSQAFALDTARLFPPQSPATLPHTSAVRVMLIPADSRMPCVEQFALGGVRGGTWRSEWWVGTMKDLLANQHARDTTRRAGAVESHGRFAEQAASGGGLSRLPLSCGLLILPRQDLQCGSGSGHSQSAEKELERHGVRASWRGLTRSDVAYCRAAAQRLYAHASFANTASIDGSTCAVGDADRAIEKAAVALLEAEATRGSQATVATEVDDPTRDPQDTEMTDSWAQEAASADEVVGLSSETGQCLVRTSQQSGVSSGNDWQAAGGGTLLPLGWALCNKRERIASESWFDHGEDVRGACASSTGPEPSGLGPSGASSDVQEPGLPPSPTPLERATSSDAAGPAATVQGSTAKTPPLLPVNARASRLARQIVRGSCCLVVGSGWQLTALLRPEAVSQSPLPLSSDAFSTFGKCALCSPTPAKPVGSTPAHPDRSCCHDRYRLELRSDHLSRHITMDVLPHLAKQLDSGEVRAIDATQLCGAMHAVGLNLRMLAQLRSHVKSPWVRSLLLVEAVARSLRRLLHARLREPLQVAERGFAGTDWGRARTAALLEILFGSSMASHRFWRHEIAAVVAAKYPIADLLAAEERATVRDSGFAALAGLGRLSLLARLMELAGIEFDQADVAAMVESPGTLDITAPLPATTAPDTAASVSPSPRTALASLRLRVQTKSIFDEEAALTAMQAALHAASTASPAARSSACSSASPALMRSDSGGAGRGALTYLRSLRDAVEATMGAGCVQHAQVATRLAQALRREGQSGEAVRVALHAAETVPASAGLARALALAIAGEALDDAREGHEQRQPPQQHQRAGSEGLDIQPADASQLLLRARRLASRFAPAHPLVARLSCSIARWGLRHNTVESRRLAIEHMTASFAIYDAVYGSSSSLEMVVPAIIAGQAEAVGASMGALCIAAMEASRREPVVAAVSDVSAMDAAPALHDSAAGEIPEQLDVEGIEELRAAMGAGGEWRVFRDGIRKKIPGLPFRSSAKRSAEAGGPSAEDSGRTRFLQALRASNSADASCDTLSAAGAADVEPMIATGSGHAGDAVVRRLSAALAALEDMLGYRRGHFIGQSAMESSSRQEREAADNGDDNEMLPGPMARLTSASTVATHAWEADDAAALPLPASEADLVGCVRWVVSGSASLLCQAGEEMRIHVRAQNVTTGVSATLAPETAVGGVLEGPVRHIATAALRDDGVLADDEGAGRDLWFLPVVAGTYALVITLNGRPVAVSPRPVRVVAGATDPQQSSVRCPAAAVCGRPVKCLVRLADASGNAVVSPVLQPKLHMSLGSLQQTWTPKLTQISSDESPPTDAGLVALVGDTLPWRDWLPEPENACKELKRDTASEAADTATAGFVAGLPLAELAEPLPCTRAVADSTGTAWRVGPKGLLAAGTKCAAEVAHAACVTVAQAKSVYALAATIITSGVGTAAIGLSVDGLSHGRDARCVFSKPMGSGDTSIFCNAVIPPGSGRAARVCLACSMRVGAKCLRCDKRLFHGGTPAMQCQRCAFRLANRCAVCKGFAHGPAVASPMLCQACSTSGLTRCTGSAT